MGTLQVLTGGLSDYITLNNLFGAVVVLGILFLIICITYFVNVKPYLNNESSALASANNSSADNAINQIGVNQDQEELVDDCELVAVITAAIYASMGDAVPADGFVVRSIRRVNSQKWMNS